MNYIGIIPNLDKDTDLSVTKKISEFVLKNNRVPILSSYVAQRTGLVEYSTKNSDDIYKNSDFVIVLGGDGTILSVGRKAAVFNKPLLGINLGTLGFLTDVEKSEAHTSIERVINGDYKIENRMMLEAEIHSREKIIKGEIALNDVCITRGVFSKIVDINIFVNDEFLDTYRADGVIISTPTGSTAYNLSAGGPILKPDSQIVAITPICPHDLNARSIIISANDVVTVEISDRSRGDLLVSMDGQMGKTIKGGDVIRVRKSEYYTSIIKTNNLGFYDILRKKLVMKGEG